MTTKKPTAKKPAKKVKRIVRVAIVTDANGGGGQTGMQEAVNMQKRCVRALKGHVVKVVYVGDKMSSLLDADLLIFDYGGMAMAYRREGQLSAYDYGHLVVHWLEDHPSSLVVIASTFSYQVLIEHELREHGILSRNDGHNPPNLIVGYLAFPVFRDEGPLTELEQTIADWFKV